ncbi:putative ammonium transporter 1 member 5 [Diplonema papillatum]|nr:putative ammonium transporter 1 member 5 [Diplonema papillatum]
MRQIDDPCLSIPIFLVPGCWGSLAVALFADEGYVSALHRGSPVVNDLHYGLLVGGGVQLLCRHVLAIMSIMLWAIGSSALFIRVMRRFPRYCVLTTAEANHLDKFQHGCYYTDYVRQFLEPDNELEPEPEPLPPVELSHPHSPASTSGFRNSFGARPSTVHDIPEYIAPNVVEGRLYKDFSADNDDSENDTSVDTNVLVLAHHQAKARTLKHEPSPFSTISLEHASRSRVALFFITLVIVTSASTVQDLPALVDGGTPALFAFCEDVAFEKLANTSMQFQGRVSALDGDLLSLWQLICGVIVFSMQLGFCFLEAGNVRSGSVLTIIFKNFADCALGGLCWWFIGYCLAYGESFGIWGFDANLFVFSPAPSSELFGAYPSFFLSYAYMAAACTIISGAVAERISFEAYYAMVISVCALSYPACVHWMWSSTGLLSPFSENKILANGVLDFSGSIVIHLFGGTSAVTLAYLTGPRALRGGVTVFSEEGRKIVEPHNKFQLATGTLLLWFGWFAFNGGSVRSMSQGSSGVAGNAVVTTLLSSGVSTVVGGIYSKVALGFWDISICCNSALVGLVSITAGCAYVAPPFAIVIGIVSVPCYVGFSKLTVYLGIDDVVGAGAVHAAGGAWGGLAVGLFADAGRIQAVLSDPEAGKSYGLLLGGGVGQVAVQMVGILSVAAWAILTMFILWLPLRFTIGLRVPVADEYLGLDIAKHKCHSYDYIGKLELERTRALEAVEVAQGIAVALVLFDTEKVIQILDDHQEAEAVSTFSREKEDPLLRAFRSLAENLEQYRPYLPDSLLDMANEHQAAMEDKPSDSVPPPGRGGSVTIVFTDIQNSTASWEACPEGMSKGLKLHNQVMRRCIAANCGYEVKTIGDAFMVAFDSIIDAVKFALDAHVDLYHAPWPKELLEVPYCAKDAEVLWAGPRVRIGVHCGEVNVEMNNVVGRCDYFGGTVNRAARVEGACVGGAVCVTSDVLEKIASIKKAQSNDFTCDNGLDLVDNPIVVHMGTVPLKGAGASTLSLLIPQTLAKRKGQVEQMLKTRLLSNQKRQSLSKRSSGIESVSMSMADGQSEFGDGHAKKRHHDFMKERFERIPVATTGRVEAEYDCTFDGNPEESVSMVNEALSRVLNCLDRTDGTVIALIGMSLACGWNTTKKTPLHLDNALRFVGMLYTAQARLNEGDTTSRRFYVGITTGTVLVGNVGTQSQRFVSVIGPSVKLSGCLAFTARDIDIFCLCATLIADDQPFQTIRRHMRPVDRWYFAGKAASVTVYEVRADSMKQLFVTDDTDDDDDWAWSDAYWEAYENADHVRMLSEAPQNPIVAAVAVRLREKLSLRPPLRF